MNRSNLDSERKPRSAAVTTSLVFVVGFLTSCAGQQPQSGSQPCGQMAAEGTENRRAMVTMKELAEEERRNPPAARPPRAVHAPVSGPQETGLRSSGHRNRCTGQVAPSEHNVSTASPEPAK